MDKKVYYSIVLGYEGIFRVVIKDEERLDMLRRDQGVGNYFRTEGEARVALEELKDVLMLSLKSIIPSQKIEGLNYKEIGETIKFARKRKKWTQKDLALKIDKAVSSIKKYEKGSIKIPLGTLIDLSHALGVKLFDE